MAPVVKALSGRKGVESRLCVTAQHREMLDRVLEVFGLRPDYDLNIMVEAQGLPEITAAVLDGVTKVIEEFRPDRVIVHGDTTTTFAASLAAFYLKVPVAHVEAGLRTGDLAAPWPEEANRKLTGVIADLHFAPTETARDNLLAEGVASGAIVVTGNTVIDALLEVTERLRGDPGLQSGIAERFTYLNPDRRLVLVTGHRRENFDGGLERICEAIRQLAARGDVDILYPVHLNPVVQKAVTSLLADCENVFLIEPEEYVPFVYLMDRCALILTDSGGIQEEAPTLGKPVLVMREVTERPEAVAAGTVVVVGTESAEIVRQAGQLLDDTQAYARMSRAHNPYGDGKAAGRIVEALLNGRD